MLNMNKNKSVNMTGGREQCGLETREKIESRRGKGEHTTGKRERERERKRENSSDWRKKKRRRRKEEYSYIGEHDGKGGYLRCKGGREQVKGERGEVMGAFRQVPGLCE